MKKDWILIGSILVIAAGLWGLLQSGDTPSNEVTVNMNGGVFATYSLQTDRVITLPHHQLTIKDRKAFLTQSDCAGQDCVKTGAISRNGQSILCLPYRLTITLSSSALDSVTY